jgi:hypothetical protein
LSVLFIELLLFFNYFTLKTSSKDEDFLSEKREPFFSIVNLKCANESKKKNNLFSSCCVFTFNQKHFDGGNLRQVKNLSEEGEDDDMASCRVEKITY